MKATERMGAVIYVRVSTKDQLENFSLTTQEKACREFCRSRGYSVLQVFAEAESAKTANRDEFQAMQDYCLKHYRDVAAVVVYSVSRFSRLTSDHMSVRVILDKLRIALYSATEPIEQTPSGRFTETVLSACAQLDNEVRAERTTAGMKSALSAGKWPWRAPLGFVNIIGSKLGSANLEHDNERAPLVRKAFELYAEGGRSKSKVLEIVTGLGLRDRSGKAVTEQTFDKLLRNELYAGWMAVPDWGRYRGLFDPIIDEAIFQRVQAVLSGKAPQGPKRRSLHNEDFPLRVFVRCAGCNTGVTGSFSKGNGGKYAYYSCRTQGCNASVRFRRDDLHRLFLGILEGVKLRADFTELFSEVLGDVWNQKNAQQEGLLTTGEQKTADV